MKSSSATLQWAFLTVLHALALAIAPTPFNYVGAFLWLVGAIFLVARPNDRDSEIPQLKLHVFAHAALLLGYWVIGQLNNGADFAAALGAAPDVQDTTGLQLLSTMRFVALQLSFLSVVAYVVLAVKRLFWNKPGVLFNERTAPTAAQATMRRTQPSKPSLRVAQRPIEPESFMPDEGESMLEAR